MYVPTRLMWAWNCLISSDATIPAVSRPEFFKEQLHRGGLSHGHFLQIQEALASAFFSGRLISSEDIVARVRGRKAPQELVRLRTAAEMAAVCWEKAQKKIEIGVTEILVSLQSIRRFFLTSAARRLSTPSSMPIQRPNPGTVHKRLRFSNEEVCSMWTSEYAMWATAPISSIFAYLNREHEAAALNNQRISIFYRLLLDINSLCTLQKIRTCALSDHSLAT